LGTFGRKGRGPGDFFYPGLKTCLDEKYLVFSEYASNRKISIFDFSGKCVTTLKTSSDSFEATGLKDGNIGYYSYKHEPENRRGRSTATIAIHIINMNNKNISEFPFGSISKAIIKMGSNTISLSPNPLGDFLFKQTGKGNLMLGISNLPIIKIFSPKGKQLRSFQLKMKPIPVTAQYIEVQKKKLINSFQKVQVNIEIKKEIRKSLEKYNFKNAFREYLPYYLNILIDTEGNFLVFKWPGLDEKVNEINFQVYSPDGQFICETVLNTGNFNIEVQRNFQAMQFTSNAFYGLVSKKNEEDEYQLVRMTFGKNLH